VQCLVSASVFTIRRYVQVYVLLRGRLVDNIYQFTDNQITGGTELMISGKGMTIGHGLVVRIFYIFFKIILQKYTTVRKFYTFDIHSPWPTAVVVAHDGFSTYRSGPRRFGCRLWVPTGSEVSRCGSRRLATNRRTLRQ
jgi:hypothetical protein